MLKGRILLLVLAFFTITGLFHNASAETSASSCTSILVSTPICDEFITQSCIDTYKGLEHPQVRLSALITSPKEIAPQTVTTISALQEQAPIQITPTTIAVPSEAQVPPAQTLDSDKIFDFVNQHRAALGLIPFEREESVCQLAIARSTELSGELANGSIHSGLYGRNLPYWIWENAKVGSNEEETVAWWISSPIHYQSMIGDYKYSCVKCTGNNCSQVFTSFSPK